VISNNSGLSQISLGERSVLVSDGRKEKKDRDVKNEVSILSIGSHRIHNRVIIRGSVDIRVR